MSAKGTKNLEEVEVPITVRTWYLGHHTLPRLLQYHTHTFQQEMGINLRKAFPNPPVLALPLPSSVLPALEPHLNPSRIFLPLHPAELQ